jgi:hypothetical protein
MHCLGERLLIGETTRLMCDGRSRRWAGELGGVRAHWPGMPGFDPAGAVRFGVVYLDAGIAELLRRVRYCDRKACLQAEGVTPLRRLKRLLRCA